MDAVLAAEFDVPHRQYAHLQFGMESTSRFNHVV